MRPAPSTARRAGATAAALALSASLAACHPQAPSTSTENSGNGQHAESTSATGTPSQTEVPPELETFYAQDISWTDCSDSTAAFQCGSVTVPLDYDNAGGQTITIALKKLPASDNNAELGSLFINPGGPGDSGISALKTGVTGIPEEVRSSYDIIGFDPRGVGQSTPITCSTPAESSQILTDSGNRSENEIMLLTTSLQSTSLAAQDAIDRGAADAAKCAQYSQVPELLDHIGTRDVARDLDVLRATAKDSRLNYLGTSYGTYIGAIYADLFPQHAGRIVLDSAMDPEQTSAERELDAVVYQEGMMRSYVAYCLSQGNCPLSGPTDQALTQLRDFLDGLDDSPLSATGSSSPMGRQDVTLLLSALVTSPPQWDSLTAMLAPAITQHDGTLMAESSQALFKESMPTSAEQAAEFANQTFSSMAVICNDYPDTADSAEDWDEKSAAEKTAYPFFGGRSTNNDEYCRGWGHRAHSEPAQTHATGSDPVLVIGRTGDPKTLYPWAVSLANQLDNGHLLTVEGYEHITFGTNMCATAAIADFLANGTIPDEGLTCPVDADPATGSESTAPAAPAGDAPSSTPQNAPSAPPEG